jgi:SPP1 family predicted phage head-tail adaptor
MRAGTLRHRITIQEVTETPDSAGEPTESWSAFKTVWASVEPLRGRELLRAQQIHADASYKITIRHLSGVTPKMRVLWGSRIFDIHAAPVTDSRDQKIEMLCSEDV